jgi:hypothetical protein
MQQLLDLIRERKSLPICHLPLALLRYKKVPYICIYIYLLREWCFLFSLESRRSPHCSDCDSRSNVLLASPKSYYDCTECYSRNLKNVTGYV